MPFSVPQVRLVAMQTILIDQRVQNRLSFLPNPKTIGSSCASMLHLYHQSPCYSPSHGLDPKAAYLRNAAVANVDPALEVPRSSRQPLCYSQSVADIIRHHCGLGPWNTSRTRDRYGRRFNSQARFDGYWRWRPTFIRSLSGLAATCATFWSQPSACGQFISNKPISAQMFFQLVFSPTGTVAQC